MTSDEKLWEDYLTVKELPTMSQFATRLDCMCAREKMIFMDALQIGREREREALYGMVEAIDANQMHRDTKRCLLAAIRERGNG